MIANDEDLQLVQSQITRLENGLASLAHEVRPKNEARFKLMAEGYVDQLSKLRAAIGLYLGINAVFEPQNASQHG